MINELMRRRALLSGVESLLPEGYTQMNYIENTSNSLFYIQQTLPFSFELEFTPDLTSITGGYGCMFGCDSNFQAAFMATGKAHIGNATSANVFFSTGVKAKVSGHITSSASTTNYLVNDVNTGLSRRSSTSTWFLFSAISSNYYARGKMYSFKLWDANNVLSMHFIPCKNPSNVFGMYDIINNIFHASLRDPFSGG